jgi:hypothetical protein
MSRIRSIVGLAFTSAILSCTAVSASVELRFVSTSDGGVQFNELESQGAGVPLPNYGDYNNNGIVDSADYSAFRKYLDSPDDTSNIILNDFSPGWVMAEDYDKWRERFGTSSAGGANSAAAPEPSGCALIALLGMLSLLRHRR